MYLAARQVSLNVSLHEICFPEKEFVWIDDALFYLQAILSEATSDQSFKEVEKDPSDFLRALEGLFHFAPLKTIPPDQPPNENKSNITTNIICKFSFSLENCSLCFFMIMQGKCLMLIHIDYQQ